MIREKLLDIFRAFLFKNSFDLSIFELSLERKVFQDIVELKYPIIIFTVQTKQASNSHLSYCVQTSWMPEMIQWKFRELIYI